ADIGMNVVGFEQVFKAVAHHDWRGKYQGGQQDDDDGKTWRWKQSQYWFCTASFCHAVTRACQCLNACLQWSEYIPTVARQDAVSVAATCYVSKLQRRTAVKWPRPFGLCPKSAHAALLVVH